MIDTAYRTLSDLLDAAGPLDRHRLLVFAERASREEPHPWVAALRRLRAERTIEPAVVTYLLHLLTNEYAFIDWVIGGGESGAGFRPCEKEWARELRDKCLDDDIAFFWKQWGGRTPKAGGREGKRQGKRQAKRQGKRQGKLRRLFCSYWPRIQLCRSRSSPNA